MKKNKNAPLVEKKDGKMQLSPDHIRAIERTEDVGNTMLQVAQEYTIAVEQVLMEEFDFTEEQIQHFEERLRYMLITLADVEKKGLSVLSFHDMEAISQIANIRYNRELGKRTGLILPEKKNG